MRYGGRLNRIEFTALIDQQANRIRASATTLPLYGPAGWNGPCRIGVWGWENERLMHAGLLFGDRGGESGARRHRPPAAGPGTDPGDGPGSGSSIALGDGLYVSDPDSGLRGNSPGSAGDGGSGPGGESSDAGTGGTAGTAGLGGGAWIEVVTTAGPPMPLLIDLRVAAAAENPADRRAAERALHIASSPAPQRVGIAVDGVPRPFSRWPDEPLGETAGRGWLAILDEVPGLLLRVSGLTPAEIALARIGDIEPHLSGTRAHLLAAYDAYGAG